MRWDSRLRRQEVNAENIIKNAPNPNIGRPCAGVLPCVECIPVAEACHHREDGILLSLTPPPPPSRPTPQNKNRRTLTVPRSVVCSLRRDVLDSDQKPSKRVEYATERLDLRTAEADAMEAEELQNALNQPADGGPAAGGISGEPRAAGGGVGEAGAGGATEDASEAAMKGMTTGFQ